MDAADRGRLLFKLAELVEKNADELAALESLNCGKTISDSKGDMAGVANTLRYYAGWADKIEGRTIPVRGSFLSYTLRQPVGVVGQIIPWNFPVLDAGLEMGPCPGLWQHRRAQAGRTDAADRTPRGGARTGGRFPRRRGQRRQRHGRDDRRRPWSLTPTSTRSPSPVTSIPPRSFRKSRPIH